MGGGVWRPCGEATRRNAWGACPGKAHLATFSAWLWPVFVGHLHSTNHRGSSPVDWFSFLVAFSPFCLLKLRLGAIIQTSDSAWLCYELTILIETTQPEETTFSRTVLAWSSRECDGMCLETFESANQCRYLVSQKQCTKIPHSLLLLCTSSQPFDDRPPMPSPAALHLTVVEIVFITSPSTC